MSETIHPAIAKSEALKTLVEQWTLEISEIKSPEREYREKRESMLSNYDDELLQLRQHSPDTYEFARRSEAILQQAGDLRELEIQYQSSATLLEQQFVERLEEANKMLACDLFPALGDTLWDHSVASVLNECIRPKTPTVEAAGAEEGCSTLLEARNDQEADSVITAEEPIDLEAGQVQSSLPITGSSERQNQAVAEVPGLTEANVSIPLETLDQRQAVLHQTPVQERESASQSTQVTQGQGGTITLAAQVPTPSPTTEVSRPSDNVVDPQAKSSPVEKPVSEMNSYQNGGTARWDMWQTSRIPNQSASSTDGPETLNNKSPGEQPTDSLVVHLRAPLKRLQSATPSRKQKRQKLPVEPPDIPEERVVPFDQVFQDGNAQNKYIIVQHPPEFGHWYILECKEHNKHFYKDPIRGASRHLMGQEHGINGEHSFAVKMLGTRVLHCNEKLAAKNNRVTRQAFPLVARPTSVMPGNRTKEDATQNVEIIPVVGEIYAAKFPKQSHTYAVLVLPWTAFDHFPYMKQLLRDTPSCYLFDKAVDQYPRGWARDYEDGGGRVKDRVYPVVYFHKENFPQQCDIGWVPLTSFKVYDPKHTGVVCSKIVDRYLQNKDPRLTAKHGYSANNSIIISDGDADTEQGNGEISGDSS
ncbi:hypothetical protein FPCIR_11537 [Fusarium pseudocircinatum]|uniref:Uncharacterized protein n=1 Tax=Fusarium pseudocircinatum TaxID=56676 RepID=A0A8H5NTD3_9HYPO|nr:hypothetical protein FPCIR_11537 [Fusarium pseudocircinatum]